MGPLSCQLETKLKEYLKVDNLLFVANGTVALQMAIKALNLSGEIITTSYSFVATTSSIIWEGCTPVFVDIDSQTLNIDASKIEDAVTEETSAILATHIYGNPCDIEKIDEIARKHNLKVIYDGAHAFGVRINNKSVFEYGNISICSLHATKSYHSVEGGLIISRDSELIKKLQSMRNFGFDADKILELGINAKNSELHAAIGLANLKYIDEIISKRKELTEHYIQKLKAVKGVFPLWNKKAIKNYAYFPIIFETEELLKISMEILKSNGIFTRRHFYPPLPKSLPYVTQCDMPVTDEITGKVLCLPLFFDLSFEDVDLIANLLSNIESKN
jgi:dTDP-4-amino-4,6-dideoxygalactose transaminase